MADSKRPVGLDYGLAFSCKTKSRMQVHEDTVRLLSLTQPVRCPLTHPGD